jgi:hypothetical protein
MNKELEMCLSPNFKVLFFLRVCLEEGNEEKGMKKIILKNFIFILSFRSLIGEKSMEQNRFHSIP